MRRAGWLLVPWLALGCDALSVTSSCDRYRDAVESCLEEAGEEAEIGFEACDEYVGQDAYLQCLSAAYYDADCSTSVGLNEALQASAECEDARLD